MAASLFEDLDHRDARPPAAVGGGMAFLRSVAKAELDRVDVQLKSELVHRRLQREVGLWRAWSAIGVDRCLVGGHLVSRQLQVRDHVRPAEKRARDARMPTAGGAVVEVIARAQGDELAVALGAQLDFENGGGRRVRDHELLLSRKCQPQWPAYLTREQSDKFFEQRNLAPETPAHGHRHHSNFVPRYFEDLRDLIAQRE